MYRMRFILKLMMMFPGTALHELAHYIPALLLNAKPSLSLMPSFKHGTAGRVTFREPSFGLAKTLIALTPIVWWYVLATLLVKLHLLDLSVPHMYRLEMALMYNPSINPFEYAALALVSLQLLWAGGLSRKDLENAVDGLASFSGALTLIALSSWWYITG